MSKINDKIKKEGETMKIISIFVGKIFVIIGKLMHRGSSLPGMKA